MYYLGVDGGGTKTKVVIIDHQEQLIYEHTAGPSSIDTVSFETSIDHINQALNPWFNKHPQTIFESIFIGVGGIVFDHQKEAFKKLSHLLYGYQAHTIIQVENDMYNALFSSGNFNEGMALICGTGMVAFGIDKDGHTHKSGGWGYKEGEIGSGYALGKSAIQYMIRAYDKRYPLDDFAKEIAKQIGLQTATDIVPIMEKLHNDRTKVASLAPIVTKYANQGHSYATDIVKHATDEVALAVKAVYSVLQFQDNISLVLIGSLGLATGLFNTLLINKINSISSSIKIIKEIYSPAEGAARYAKYLINKS